MDEEEEMSTFEYKGFDKIVIYYVQLSSLGGLVCYNVWKKLVLIMRKIFKKYSIIDTYVNDN